MNEARDQALEAWTLRLLLASGFISKAGLKLAPCLVDIIIVKA